MIFLLALAFTPLKFDTHEFLPKKHHEHLFAFIIANSRKKEKRLLTLFLKKFFSKTKNPLKMRNFKKNNFFIVFCKICFILSHFAIICHKKPNKVTFCLYCIRFFDCVITSLRMTINGHANAQSKHLSY